MPAQRLKPVHALTSFDSQERDNKPWAVSIIRAIKPNGQEVWPGRGDLVKYRDQYLLSSALFGATYMQDPSGLAGEVFKPEWLKYFTLARAALDPVPGQAGLPTANRVSNDLPDGLRPMELPPWPALKPAIGVDLALSKKETADYCAIAAGWHTRDGDLFIAEVWRGHVASGEALAKIVQMADRYQAGVVGVREDMMERTLRGMLPLFPDASKLPWWSVSEVGDKVTKWRPLAAKYETGHVYHPWDASWLRWYELELLAAPGGIHDDAIDAVAALCACYGLAGAHSPQDYSKLMEGLRAPQSLPGGPTDWRP